MPRSPEDPVIRDSSEVVWTVFREGLYQSNEVSASGHWHPSRVGTPWQSIQSQTPYGRQQRPTTLSIIPPSPHTPTTPHTPHTPPVRTPLAEVRRADVNVLQVELAKDDRKRAAREAALRKIDEGMRELKLAEQM